MAYPNPSEAPAEFGNHLKSLGLDFPRTVFDHYLNRPFEADGRLDDAVAQGWCERMDSLLGKLNRVVGSQPNHLEVLGALSGICTTSVAAIEGRLEEQKESDALEAIRRKEEEEKKAEEERCRREEEERIVKLAREAAAREKAERLQKVADEEMAIMLAERDLKAKKQAFIEAQKAVGTLEDGNGDDNNNNEEEQEQGNESAGEGPQGMTSKTKEEARNKMPQTIHETACTLCAKNNSTCSGPIGQACAMCWKFKKSCSNGGLRRPREATTKKEQGSPVRTSGRKRKVYSTTGANAIGFMEPTDVFADSNSTQPVGKRTKTAPGSSSHVQFDGPIIAKSTRKSARTAKANTKKDMGELFAQLAQECRAMANTFDELSKLDS